MSKKYERPMYNKKAFTCPFCSAFSQIRWATAIINSTYSEISRATCLVCNQDMIWYKEEMVIPLAKMAPMPLEEMPDGIKQDYLEARAIVADSPRGACAVLRIALDKLCDYLIGENSCINLKIKLEKLVELGIPHDVVKLFDAIRVGGNDSVHELGFINVSDNPERAQIMFKIMNVIVQRLIVDKNEFDDFYSLIPDSKKVTITE